MNNVKISIIVPIYNDEKHLHQCLNSLINQSLKEMEIICVNDESTDKSEEIIKEFLTLDDRVKYYSMGKNSGSGLARNKGLENAKGEYVSFVDSDDHVIGLEVYEKIYNFAYKKNADMVSTNLKSFNNDGEYFVNNFCIEYTEELPILPQDYGIPWYHQKNIYKKKFLNEHNIEYPYYKRGQDPVFLAKVLKNIKIIYCLPIDFYAYRTLSIKKVNSDVQEYDYIKHFHDVLEILDINTFKETHLKYEERLFYYFSSPQLFHSTKSLERSVKRIFGDNSRTHKIFKMYKSLIWKEKENNQLKETILNKEKENNQLRETILNKEKENNQNRSDSQYNERFNRNKSDEITKINDTIVLDSDELNSQIKYIFEDFYETLFKENIGRSVTQKMLSKFPSIYIILKRDNNIRNAFINIKGYHSIKKNNLFDVGFYLRNYPEVRKLGIDPLLHYIVNGFKESRIPHPSFDYKYYLARNVDVKDSKLNPLVHYSLYGQKEKRKIRENSEIDIKSFNIVKSAANEKTTIELTFNYPIKFDKDLIKLENDNKKLIPIDLKLFKNRILVIPLESLIESDQYNITLYSKSIKDMYNHPITHCSIIFSFNKISKRFEVNKIQKSGKIANVYSNYEHNTGELSVQNNSSENQYQYLKNRLDSVEKNLSDSRNNIENLNKNNTKIEEKTIYLETLLNDIHESAIEKKKICPICESEILAFLPYGIKTRANAMCPNCRSLERHRGAYLLLKEKTNYLEKHTKMLHFAPEGFLAKLFSSKKNIDYLPVDIDPNLWHVKEKMDIQDINYPDNTFDLIYCSHVLEHIPDDKKAMNELFRVMKHDGAAIIMTPLKHSKETLEDPSINTPELRLKYYLQSDHQRLYGFDIKEKLENAGFKVSNDFLQKLDKQSLKKYGLNPYEIIFFCTK